MKSRKKFGEKIWSILIWGGLERLIEGIVKEDPQAALEFADSIKIPKEKPSETTKGNEPKPGDKGKGNKSNEPNQIGDNSTGGVQTIEKNPQSNTQIPKVLISPEQIKLIQDIVDYVEKYAQTNKLDPGEIANENSKQPVDKGVAFGTETDGICYGDIDNDGDRDIFVVSSGQPDKFFKNNGNGEWVDITSQLPVIKTTNVGTTVSVPESQTTVLGGVFNKNRNSQQTQIDKIAMTKPGALNQTEDKAIPIREAQDANKVKVDLNGPGNNTLVNTLVIENISGGIIKLIKRAFLFFAPSNPSAQWMVNVKDPIITLNAGEKTKIEIETMCVSTKLEKPPQPEGSGITYKISDYPDSKVQEKLIAIIKAAEELEKKGKFASVPLNKTMRWKKIAQTTAWKYLGDRTKRIDDDITRKSMSDELVAGLNTTYEKLEKKKREAVDRMVDAILAAVDKTLKAANAI